MEALPSLIYLGLTLLGIGFIISEHGKPRKPYNAWESLISTALVLMLLYWGGFFDPLLKVLFPK